MARSLKKGPFVASDIFERVEKMNQSGKKETIKKICFILLALVLKKTFTDDDRLNEVPKAFFRIGHVLTNSVDGRSVADFEFTSQRVGHQFLGQAAVELMLSIHQEFSKFRYCAKRLSAR